MLVPGKKGSFPNSITPDGTIYGCDHNDDFFGSMVGFGRTRFGAFITLDAGGGDPKQLAAFCCSCNPASLRCTGLSGLQANGQIRGGTRLRNSWVGGADTKVQAAAAFGALLLLTGFDIGAQKFAASQPSADHALIYIYRKGGILGAVGRPILFVNDYLLAQFYRSNYASAELPPGSAVITATLAFSEDLPPPEPIGAWANLPGCVAVDWRRVAAARPEDISLCTSGLRTLVKECAITTTITGCSLPGCIKITTTRIPSCAPKLNGSTDALFLLAVAPQLQDALANGIPSKPSGYRYLHTQLRIDAEAGKTYYVKWSVSGSGGKMELMDAAKGEKEIRGLHLAAYALGPANQP